MELQSFKDKSDLLTLSGSPDILTYSDAFYIPQIDYFDGKFGIFSKEGHLILQSAYFEKSPPKLKGQPLWSNPQDVDTRQTLSTAVYVGSPSLQYGHFITEFISRLWFLSNTSLDYSGKLLVHSPYDIDFIFGHAWVHEIVSSLGLKKNDFICPKLPFRIRELVVPTPAFCEDSYVYRAFPRICHEIRNALGSIKPTHKKIYLSRSKLKSGTVKILNENILEEHLCRNGFEVVHPETLSITSQISLFDPGNFVTGILGSAFHSSIFSKQPFGLALSAKKHISKNFFLMDKANNSNIKYGKLDMIASDASYENFYETNIISNINETIDTVIEQSSLYPHF